MSFIITGQEKIKSTVLNNKNKRFKINYLIRSRLPKAGITQYLPLRNFNY